MIAKMQKIRVIGLQQNRKAVTEQLQKLGNVEFSDLNLPDTQKLELTDRILQFERYLSSATRALAVLDEYVPAKTGMFTVRKLKSMDSYSMGQNEAKIMGDFMFSVASAHKKIGDNQSEIAGLQTKIDSMVPWQTLDVPLNYGGTRKTDSFLGSIPCLADEQAVKNLLGDADIHFEIISAEKECTRVFFLFLKEEKDQAEKILREAGFVPLPFPLSSKTVREKIKQLEQKIRELTKDSAQQRESIVKAAERREELQLFYDHIVLRRDKYEQIEKMCQTEKTFVIEGFVPRKKADKVVAKLSEKGAYAELFEPTETEDVPVLLENNAFARPVETITSTYSLPGKGDVDPNMIMAIFYYIFFGMMFSDAGYGLLQSVVCGYLGFFARVEEKTRQNMRMFFFCGLSTLFWGVMYGSFFGNALTVILDTFFGVQFALTPLWLDPVTEPLTLLIFSVAIGVVQILAGLMLKFYVFWRQGDKLSALFDVGFWIVILLGGFALAGGMALGISVLTTAGTAMMIGGAIGLVLTQGRAQKNIVMKLFGGILSLYDVTSYVSDALSYSRLMALGLATGVIAQVVNTMGALGGSGIVGVIAFAIIFIIGHAINFALNCLGAYVHTNRLQYVEFFSKFYEGGGRAFTPLKMDTKYYEFTEE